MLQDRAAETAGTTGNDECFVIECFCYCVHTVFSSFLLRVIWFAAVLAVSQASSFRIYKTHH